MLDLAEIQTRLTAQCTSLGRVSVGADLQAVNALLSACLMLPDAVVSEYSEQSAGTPQINAGTLQNIQANFSVFLAVSPDDYSTLGTQRDAIVAALTDYTATGMEFPCYFTNLELALEKRYLTLWRLKFFTGYSNQSAF